jgi:ABC-type glutathione transport system ATPase component
MLVATVGSWRPSCRMVHALEVHELWKTFVVGVRGCSARVSVLRGVSFHVGAGERVGIVGAPGAGKTTLLHCIAGLRRVDGGTVRSAPPPPDAIVLLDEGMREPPRATAFAALLVARHASVLRGRVDRLLVLHDGRVAQLAPDVDSPRAARRVAEPPHLR